MAITETFQISQSMLDSNRVHTGDFNLIHFDSTYALLALSAMQGRKLDSYSANPFVITPGSWMLSTLQRSIDPSTIGSFQMRFANPLPFYEDGSAEFTYSIDDSKVTISGKSNTSKNHTSDALPLATGKVDTSESYDFVESMKDKPRILFDVGIDIPPIYADNYGLMYKERYRLDRDNTQIIPYSKVFPLVEITLQTHRHYLKSVGQASEDIPPTLFEAFTLLPRYQMIFARDVLNISLSDRARLETKDQDARHNAAREYVHALNSHRKKPLKDDTLDQQVETMLSEPLITVKRIQGYMDTRQKIGMNLPITFVYHFHPKNDHPSLMRFMVEGFVDGKRWLYATSTLNVSPLISTKTIAYAAPPSPVQRALFDLAPDQAA